MNENSPKQFTWAIVSKTKQEEKGVAIILALALLVILLLVGIAYVSLAKIDRKIAASKLDTITAKLSAESVLERVIGSIQLYNNDLTDGKIYPGTSSFFKMTSTTDNGWNNRRVIFTHDKTGDQDKDLIEHFKTSFKNSEGNSLDYIGWDDTVDLENIHWKYLKIDKDGDGNKDKILGRIAYIIIDESGKLDPNYITTGSSRIGEEVSEISLAGAGVASPVTFTDSLNGAPKWFSWAHIIGETSFDQNELDTCTASLFPFSKETPEAFWLDNNNDDKYDDGELFHRFNLARTDWDSLNVSSITTGDAEQWSDNSTTHDGTGIPWFKNWGIGKEQVIANLLDYCDTDSIPKTDSDGTTAPTYLGLEKTAYINEINLTFSQTPVVKASVAGGADYSWNAVSVAIEPEIVNVYLDQVSACTLTLNYEITGTINNGHAVSYPLKSMDGVSMIDGLSGTSTFTYSATDAQSFQAGVINLILSLPGSYVTPDEGLPVNLTINDIKLSAFLKDGSGNLIDYAVIATDANAVDLDLHPSIKYANYQTNDPRHNQFIGEWTANTGDTDNNTLAATNSSCNPGATGDQEPGTVPWVSTCYIRNAPMQSPWELGCIHRGAAWETINLKAYNKDDNGGGDYAKGDANILNQVKMTSDTISSPGKVNINSASLGALKALVTIPITGKYDADPLSGIPGNTTTIAQEILYENGSEVPPVGPIGAAFTSRAQVANADIETGFTDAAKEEIIGKFINLTQVRHNFFTVFILAQSINKGGKITAEQKILAVIYRDAYTNECKVPYYEVLWEKTF